MYCDVLVLCKLYDAISGYDKQYCNLLISFCTRIIGSSFITDHYGAIKIHADRETSGAVLVAEVDLAAARTDRASWGFFRDRRPDLYSPIMTKDGCQAGKTPM